MSARDWALFELDSRRLPGWMPRLLRGGPRRLADPRDVALGEQILIGSVKNLLLLRYLIEYLSDRALKSIDPLVQKILVIALYQMRFLTRVPASAAVNEAVEQAKRFGRGKSGGFVNAVLRNFERRPAPPLPDREKEPAKFAEIGLSHPRELFERLERLVGSHEAIRICEHDNAQPPMLVRLNAGATAADLEGATIKPHQRAGLFVAEDVRKATLADWAARGIAQVQDATAAGVVPAMRCEAGERVLDRCAGLGTKTLQLRDAVSAGGNVVAMDPNAERCEELRRVLATRSISNVSVYPVGRIADVPALKDVLFDRVLVDVPCSNSGVLARRPEARYSQNQQAIDSIRKVQDMILDDTAPHVRPGGLLAYSTCSIWPEENELQVGAFLVRHPEFELLEAVGTLPSINDDPTRYHDGGFYALLRRRE